jgi:predicted ATP-dependent endonuclease of OLD family
VSLRSIEVSGYRGFKDKGILNLAVPDGRPGSGLTILTGPNNSGKSSIIECLRARQSPDNPTFSEGVRNRNFDKVEFVYNFDTHSEYIRSISQGSALSERSAPDRISSFFCVPSRRAFNPYFSKGAWNRDNYTGGNSFSAQRESSLSMFQYRLFNIAEDTGNTERFNKLLEKVIGFKANWSIDLSDHGQYYLRFVNESNSVHSSNGLGEGIVSIFSIVDSLYDSRTSDVIVIDEPELSLHPSLQRRLSMVFGEFSRDRQILVATHSPYFTEISQIQNGANLARICTNESGSHIHQLGSNGRTAIETLTSGNLLNPHIFGLDAREMFFLEDGIVITEGQEDVLLYPKVCDDLGIVLRGSYFGWGAGGAGNIKHVCSILADLGFKKVAAVLDGNKMGEITPLLASFPNFHFSCIPAEDIRSKKPRKETCGTSGILDSDMCVRQEHVDAMRNLLTEMNLYLEQA